MKGVRVSIARLMVLTVLCTVLLASFRVATAAWVDVTRFLTVSALALSAYLARYRSGDEGAWWFGFALSGWACFVLLIDASAGSGPSLGPNPAAGFAQTSVMAFLMASPEEYANAIKKPGLYGAWWNRSRIVQYMLILVVASLGGLACWLVAWRRGAPSDVRVWPAGVWRTGDGGGAR
jgi:hypothetical protein